MFNSLNQHISILKLELFNQEIHIYGLYTFYNKNSFENSQNQINLLNICEEAISTSRELKHSILVMGDFLAKFQNFQTTPSRTRVVGSVVFVMNVPGISLKSSASLAAIVYDRLGRGSKKIKEFPFLKGYLRDHETTSV